MKAAPKLLAFGEILWDVVEGREHIGGAPFNVAAHAAQCGLRVSLFSRVGSDDRGKRAGKEIGEFGVEGCWVQTDPIRPTGWVDVILDAGGQPFYTIGEDVAWDAIEAPEGTEEQAIAMSNFQAIYFGTLAQRSARSREALRRLRALLPRVLVFYDVNLRGPHTNLELVRNSLPGVSVLKVNEAEAETMSREIFGKPFEPLEFFRVLSSAYNILLVVVTRAEKGCILLERSGAIEIPATPVEVVSAVGAGDAFSAAFLAALLSGETPSAAARKAGILGAKVAGSPEAVPKYGPTRWREH
jgi:fructokinase